MADLCEFELHARVKIADEKVLLEMKRKFGLESGYTNTNRIKDGFSILDTYLDEYGLTNGYYFLHISGDCKWSVYSSFYTELKEWASNYKIDIEIYSTEPGFCFQEYFKWIEGELVDFVCKDMIEFHVDDIMDAEDGEYDYLFNHKLCVEANCTKDNYQSFADEDGYVKLGGFPEENFEF